MNFYESVGRAQQYSPEALEGFKEIDRRVRQVFAAVEAWQGWQAITAPESSSSDVLAFVKEIYRSVCWYQPHTTEAAFHMIGRFPKAEVRLMQILSAHKAEEAEHGVWAQEDLGKLGFHEPDPASPASFAVGSVWWRMASTEEPLGYLGAEYLYEQLTALATAAALPIIDQRQLPRDELRFVIEHATEDAKHAVFLKHVILDVLTRYPHALPAMLRCFDYFLAVWPLPVWKEAFDRARA